MFLSSFKKLDSINDCYLVCLHIYKVIGLLVAERNGSPYPANSSNVVNIAMSPTYQNLVLFSNLFGKHAWLIP